MIEHRQIAEWLASGPPWAQRRCEIKCVVESCVTPYPAGIIDSTAEYEGVFWEVECTVAGTGMTGRARTLDEAFAVSLDWLRKAVA